jgi:hypothetical protein
MADWLAGLPEQVARFTGMIGRITLTHLRTGLVAVNAFRNVSFDILLV